MQPFPANMEQLLAAISCLIITLKNGIVTSWSQLAEKTFGIRASEVVGRILAEYPIPWETQSFLEALEKINLPSQGPLHLKDQRYRDSAGTNGFLDLILVRLEGSAPSETMIAVLGLEVTNRKIIESQVLESQKLEAIGQLAAGIAHEINTPIQYMGDNIRFLQESFCDLYDLLGHYQRLLDTLGTDNNPVLTEIRASIAAFDVSYLLQEIPTAILQSLEGIDRVAVIVRAMKDFAHPDLSQQKIPIDLNRAIESTLIVAHNEWKYVADLSKDLDPDLPSVPCLAGQFNQVILNLIVNAAHAIGDVVQSHENQKGLISISTQRVDGGVEIRIADTGPGIPEPIRDKIFNPFFTTKPVGKGTGQGLAIARSVIVEKHGGQLTFETEIGKGTTFIIRLPIQPAPEEMVT
jgi:PAS domain S-box-containing protein